MRNFKYKASDGKYHFSATVNAGILNPNDTTYEFGFRVDSAGAVVYADDFSVTAIEPAKPKHIALAETVFAPGTSLQVTVTEPADGSWVGVFASGVIPNSNNYDDYSWKYCKYAASDGTLLMKVPAEPGKYTLTIFRTEAAMFLWKVFPLKLPNSKKSLSTNRSTVPMKPSRLPIRRCLYPSLGLHL